MSLTVLIPFFNEEKYLKESVENLIKADVGDKLILVDDCSTDNSFKIAKNLSTKYDFVTLLRKEKNEGKGSCIKYALDLVDTEFFIVHDADLEQDPNDIELLYAKCLNNKDSIILGSRVIVGRERLKKYFTITIANYFLSNIFSLLNHYKISDISSGYILTPVSFLKNIDIKEKSFGYEVEILSKFLKYNRSIIEIPISYNGRTYEEGKKINLIDGINILIKIFKYRFFN